MCGYTITRTGSKSSIKHRGTSLTTGEFKRWQWEFASLPLSSNKDDSEQPFIRGNKMILFNGEIFNYKLLNSRSTSDLDYLHRLFDKTIGDYVKIFKESRKWEGFWSITIFDRDDLWFFTDPLGKKQLYYSKYGVSSEIRPICGEHPFIWPYRETKFGTLNTPFGDVKRAIPGSLYCYRRGHASAFKAHVQKYFNHIITPITDNLYDLIDWNVKIRVENRIDKPSIFLSGGLDSNIVLHHLLKHSPIWDIEILTIDNSETDIVNRIADHYGIKIRIIDSKISDDEKYDAIKSYEHPYDLGSLYPNYTLSKNLTNSMVLTGDGADELFGGYRRASISDTYDFDVFKELPYYHNIRLDRMGMRFTKEIRSPLMANSLVAYSKVLPHKDRANKSILRSLYKDILPPFITKGKKKPLRLDGIKDHGVKEKFMDIFGEDGRL